MASSTRISVTSTPASAFSGVGNVLIKNHPGGADVYLGDSSVTTSNGFLLSANQTVQMNVNSPDEIYVVNGGSGSTVSVLSVR